MQLSVAAVGRVEAASNLDVLGMATPPAPNLPTVSQVLADFAMRVQGLCKLQADTDARAAVTALIAMLKLVPESEGAQAEAAAALAQCMAESGRNRSVVEETGGTEALVALMNSRSATPPMLISACHAIHMLVRNPENCAAACRAGAHVPVTRMAQLARSAELAGGATPAAGTLCHLAESSAHARTLLRDAGAAEPLASLILVSAETGSAGDSAASKFAGFALLSLVQEEPQVVIDAVDKVCRGEPQFSRALETSCPECLEMLQKHVMSRLRVAMDGSDVKVLQDLLALGHGVNLTAGFLKDAKAKFRAVMQRAEESNKARGADKAGGADKAKTEAANGPPSRRAASPAKPRLAKTGAVAGTAALDELRHLKALEVAELSARSKAGTGTGKGAAPSSAVTSAAAAEQPAASHRIAFGGAPTAMRVASAALVPRSTAVPNAIAAYAPPVTLAGAANTTNGTAFEPLRPTTTPMATLFGSSDTLMEAGLLLNEGLGSVRKAFEQAIVGMRAEKEKLYHELQLEQERSRQLAAQPAATMLLHGQKEAAELEREPPK